VSTDAEDFCPSARLKLVRKAVCHFSKNLPEEDQITIEHCLDLIEFGMQSTLLAFVDKCCEHDGDRDPEEKGLTIGGCESAWLADLVGAYILDNTKSHFRKTKCCGLCRDDGMAVFNNKLSCDDMLKWRTKFQNSVNRLAGGNHLQFTCSMWPDKSRRELPTEQNDPKMSIETGNFFPCLDTELVWATNGNLLAIPSAPQTKPTTKASKRRQQPHQSMLQSHAFRSLQKTVQTDNDHGNKQEPTARQNLPTTLPSSTTCRTSHQKSPKIDWTTTTQRRSQSCQTS